MSHCIGDTGFCKWLSKASMIVFVGMMVISWQGCSSIPKDYYPTSGRLMRDVPPTGNYLRKIAVTRVINSTFMANQKLDQAFQLILMETLSERCGETLIVTPNDPDHPGFLDQPPRLPGRVLDNFALAAEGRKEGFNAIVTASIAGLATRKERTGIWRFRRTHHYLQVLVFIDVFDTATAAKLLSQPDLREFEIDEADAQIIEAGKQIVIPELNHTLDQIAEQAGNKICGVVAAEPWKGFIVGQVHGGVLISAGSRQGLAAASQFEVFEASAIIEGAEGEKYIAPGFKIGEVEITKLGEQESEARILTRDPLAVGSILRPKP
jgi:hypothetical protein